MKYECVKSFEAKRLAVEDVGSGGFFMTDSYTVIQEGTVWEILEGEFRAIGERKFIFLEDAYGRWMEICEDVLANHFVQVIGVERLFFEVEINPNIWGEEKENEDARTSASKGTRF